MSKFTFPALSAGPPSRRNWYKELLDHPDCAGDSVRARLIADSSYQTDATKFRVQEAYQSHREAYGENQRKSFNASDSNPVMADQALIKHLGRLERPNNNGQPNDELDTQDVNCLVIWARPPMSLILKIQNLQKRIASVVGPDLHVIPSEHLHLSIIELSHRHSVSHLQSVANEIGKNRIFDILNLVSTLSERPRLVHPQLSFDKMGIALNLVPAKDDKYSYHHLRSDMHELALGSGVSIDMCYTAPSAHITLGRFIGNSFFGKKEGTERFLRLTDQINEELEDWQEAWKIGENLALELHLGYLKFGREREKAYMTG